MFTVQPVACHQVPVTRLSIRVHADMIRESCSIPILKRKGKGLFIKKRNSSKTVQIKPYAGIYRCKRYMIFLPLETLVTKN